MSKPYEFMKEGDLFVLRDPHTGKHWDNYIYNRNGYVLAVSQAGRGRSWLVDENGIQAWLNREEGRCLYLRDEESGVCWSPSLAPLMEPVEDYVCEHGMAHTRISSRRDGIDVAWTLTVPEDMFCDLWRVEITNGSDRPRVLSIFPLLKFDLGGFTQPAYYCPETTSYTRIMEDMQGVFCHNLHPYNPHPRYSGYLAASEKPAAMDGDLNVFCDALASFARPRVLLEGGNCTGSKTALRGRGAVLQNTVKLAPGESRVLYYCAGLGTDPESAVKEVKAAFAQAPSWFENLAEYGKSRFGTLRARTPEPRVNTIMNFWAQKQVGFCMVGKKAVRDNAQIGMGLLNSDAAMAERAICECLAHQYADGHAALTWSPALDKKTYSDPPMWLILSVCELVKETGNREFPERTIPYLDQGQGTVYEHLQRAADWLVNHRGSHGLPLIRYADWCDALNIPGQNGESVFMAMGTCWALKELADLALWLGDTAYAQKVREERDGLARTVNEVAWNGDYYIRAFNGDERIGDKDSAVGGTIYANPQSWSILGDVCPPEREEKVFSALNGMDTGVGIPLCAPPYGTYYPPVGRMSGMLPGNFENGGVYNHAVGFKVMAELMRGRADSALASLQKVIPDHPDNPCSRSLAEPYVFVNCWVQHPAFKNRTWGSWKTGTSAWSLRGFYEGMLGLRRSYQGLQVRPCLPSAWQEVTARRIFREAEYELHYRRGKEERTIVTVDGREVPDGLLPCAPGNKYRVEISLG